MSSLVTKYGPATETLYLSSFRESIGLPIVQIIVFKDSFKVPIEMADIMKKKPIFDVYDLVARSMTILKYLRETGQKAAIKEAYHAEGIMESEWADVFLVL